ncbi:MAG: TIGR04182 family glycosyltransferase [Archaeoglobales archaeon]|nr:MAG: TIGR04182 family glycosyltransferase [Archaeoglobales archaeon]
MNVTIVIPTLNEEGSIGDVVEGFKSLGYDDILVIDGNSTDRTREIAKDRGARVIVQSGKGKGQAISEAFQILNSDVLVLIDGDGTYLPNDVEKLLEPIRRGVADHVIGNRMLNFEKGAFTRLNLIGNKILNALFRFTYGVELKDILSGYRALRREVYKEVDLKKHGFEVEAELTVETLAKGFRIVEVPIFYKRRVGRTKLNPLRDGFKIGWTVYNLLIRFSPARFFLLFGLFLIFLGLIVGSYVVYEWFRHVSHDLLAVLTTLLIVSGLQIIVFGVISDFVFRSNVQIRREICEVKRSLEELKDEGKRD